MRSGIIFVLYGFLVFNQFFNCIYYPDSNIPIAIFIVVVGLAIFRKGISVNNPNMPFEKYIILLYGICPLVSIIPCYLFHGQSFGNSIYAIVTSNISIGMYWYLHSKKIPPNNLIHLVLFLAVIWSLIELVEQITYPSYLFALRTESVERGTVLELRNGVWRYMIQPWFVGFFACMYLWCKILSGRRSVLTIVLFCISLLGIYLYITRVVIATTIISLFISYIIAHKKKRVSTILFLTFFAYIIYLFSETLFGELIEQTQKQANDDEDIRLVQLVFYGIQYFPHWLCNIFGNGLPSFTSSYGKEIMDYEDLYSLWRADIGIVGDYNIFGIQYTIVTFLTFWKVFRVRKIIDNYIVYLFLGLLLCSYIMPPFRGSHLILLSIMFYLSDVKIMEYRKMLASNMTGK